MNISIADDLRHELWVSDIDDGIKASFEGIR
jgi:hypothetical protein